MYASIILYKQNNYDFEHYSLSFQIALVVSQSVFLGFVVEYIFTEGPSDEQIRNVYLYATGLSLCALGLPFVYAHGCCLRAYMIGMDTRIITTSAIFQKVTIE